MLSSVDEIVNDAWSVVDDKQRGFIYSKEMPELVRHLNTIVNHNLTTRSNDEAIANFAKENEFYKLDKNQFKEKFQAMVGTSLCNAIEMATINDTKPRLFGSIRRLNNSSEGHSREELQKKDEELARLKQEIGDWKGKYEFLEREFMFYRTRHESVLDSTQHEFIISEMKRTMNEQKKMIGQLKQQMKSKAVHKADTRITIVDTVYALVKHLFFFITGRLRIAVVLLALVYMFWYMVMSNSKTRTNYDTVMSRPPRQTLWERSDILSALYWYITDKFEPTSGINYTFNENYNSLFGL